MEQKPTIVSVEGQAFISIDAMIELMQLMIQIRDEHIEQDQRYNVLIPGSDQTVRFLTSVLEQARYEFFNEENLEDESDQMIKELYGFLRGK